ncbi:MAG TPA: hypothetical protein DCG50_11345, partial [Elusimicrobia bacterium]|nr:hypothetical protein [Elusimicrobiota bacterium]
MIYRRGKAKPDLSALILGVSLSLLPGAKAAAQETLCAEVRLEIKQEATLEREAFDAALEVTNQYPAYGLESFRVNVIIKDPAGHSADGMFFVKISSKENINAVDGTGIIQPTSTATIHWLIIPSTGTGSINPLGMKYSVKADISYKLNGVYYSISTFEDFITVKPQPVLKLEYVLPFEVFADEPLTDTIEPIEPFPLGVRITNVGYGPAKNFQINSGQPEIIENKQGLAIDFKLLGTYVGDKKIPDTLLIPFGDVFAGGVKQAAWIMSTTLSGRFTQFTATFTHSAELGGALTSLIQNVTTYTLIKDVLVDLPGHDSQFDFLVNTTMPRGSIEELLKGGGHVEPDVILESDQPTPIQVAHLESELIGDISGANTSAKLRFTEPYGSNLWVFTSVAAPQDGKAKLVSAVRNDGKTISTNNIWISKHFDKDTKVYSYRLNLVDYNPPSMAEYTLNFSRESLDAAPAPIADLNAFSVPIGGQAGLNWSATGEDASSGTIVGGKYLIQAATSPTSAFDPALAQVSFATNTAPGAAQTYLVKNLAGNATYYLKLWLQDTGGNISQGSNLAEMYVFPNPPVNLVVGSISSSAVSVNWSGGNNNLPIEYGIWADTDTFAPAVLAAPFKDSFDRSYVFEGLMPNTTYFFHGITRNIETLVTSEQVLLGHALTLAAPPGQIIASQIFISSFTITWNAEANNGLTQYFIQISTIAGWLPVAGESGWINQPEYTFSGLTPNTTYYAHAKARNSAGVETPYVDLGILRTKSVDSLPPVTELRVEGAEYRVEDKIYITSKTAISLSAYDDAAVLGDRLGDVEALHYSVDSDTFMIYAGTFSVAGEGGHVVKYYSVDTFSNTEAVKTSSITVDNTSPVTEIHIYGSSTTDAQGNLVVSTDHYISFISSDPESNGVASGLKNVLFSLDGGAFTVFQSTFTLAEGFHKIVYYGVDNVDNTEATHTFQAFFGQAPENISWTGLAGDGNWSNPANWLNGKLPTANDTVVLATRDTINISSPTAFHSLALGDAQGLSAPILLISTGITFTGNLTLNRNAVLTQGTTEPIHAANLYMLAGSKIEHTANTDLKRSVVNLEVAGDFVMESGSSITVDGLGYAGGSHGVAGYGPGKGIATYWFGSGAGHGGQGDCFGYAGCSAYDLLANPTDLGSGGGGGSCYDGRGGNGGGAVILTVGGVFNHNGIISANGNSGVNNSGAGGAGGTININAGNLSGNGIVTVNGGHSPGWDNGSGGGGGRIAIRVSGSNTAALAMTANSGVGPSGNGGAGTIYVDNRGETQLIVNTLYTFAGTTPITSAIAETSVLIISTLSMTNAKLAFDNSVTPIITSNASFAGTNTLAISSLTMISDFAFDNATLQQESTTTLTFIGDLTLRSGSKITAMANSGGNRLYAVNLNVAGNMDI